MNKLFCFLLFIGLATTGSAGEVSHDEAVQIVFASQKYKPEFRKFAYYTAKLDEIRVRYLNNPTEFASEEITSTGHVIVKQRTLDEVLKVEARKINNTLDGNSLTDSKMYKTMSIWSGAVPGAGPIISSALQTIDLYSDKEGLIPRTNDLSLEVLAPRLMHLKNEAPEFYQKINNEFLKRLGFSLDDNLSDLPEVMVYKNMKESRSLSEESRQALENLEKEIQQYFKDSQKEINNEKAKEVYEKKKAEVMATFSVFASGFAMLGLTESAQACEKLGKITEIAMDLKQNAEKIGPMQMANSYLMIASIALSFMSNGGGSDQAILDQLQKIYEAIQTLREEMHERFDQVDQKLAEILNTIDLEFTRNAERLNALSDKLTQANEHLKNIEQKLDDQTIAGIKRQMNLSDARCINRQLSQNFVEPMDESDFLNLCYDPYTQYSSINITQKNLNLSKITLPNLSWGRLHRPFQDHLTEIVNGIALYGNHPDFSRNEADNYPHYGLWEENVDRLLKIYEIHPNKRYLFQTDDLQAVIKSGKKLLKANTNLIVDSTQNVLRWKVINNILSQYKKQMNKAIVTIKNNLVNHNKFNFDVSKNYSQKVHVSIPSAKWKNISLCRGLQDSTIKHYETPKNNFPFQPVSTVITTDPNSLKKITHHQEFASGLSMPPEVYSVISNPAAWLIKYAIRQNLNYDFCVESFFVDKFAHKPGYNNGNGFTVDLKARVTVNLRINNKTIAKAVFLNRYNNVPTKLNMYYGHQLFEAVWYGLPVDHRGTRHHGVFHNLKSQSPSFSLDHSNRPALERATLTKNVKELKNALEHGLLIPLAKQTKKDFKYTILANELQSIDGLINLIHTSLLLGINDEIPEKRFVENQLQGTVGIVGLREMIDTIIDDNWTAEDAQKRVQLGIDNLTESLKAVESSRGRLSPRLAWLEDRLLDLENLQQTLRHL